MWLQDTVRRLRPGTFIFSYFFRFLGAQDRRVKVVAIKIAPLASELRAPAELLQVIAGRPRSPLMFLGEKCYPLVN